MRKCLLGQVNSPVTSRPPLICTCPSNNPALVPPTPCMALPVGPEIANTASPRPTGSRLPPLVVKNPPEPEPALWPKTPAPVALGFVFRCRQTRGVGLAVDTFPIIRVAEHTRRVTYASGAA